jgi:SAM-dependent methyltransferase
MLKNILPLISESILNTSCPGCDASDVQSFLQAPDRFHGRSEVYSLLRCASCSLVWLHNPPSPAEMAQHYGPDYDRLIASVGEHSPEHWITRRDTLLQYKTGGKLLDLGCSSGSFLELLKGGNWNLQGVEISEESAARAKARSGANVFVGDVLDAPFAPESFDAITCFHVFEHMYNPRAVLEKAFTWLKPGGIFFVLVPNIDCPEARFFRSFWYPLELPRHLFHFSPDSVRNLATRSGFDELSISTTRVSFMDYHMRYLADAVTEKLGFKRRAVAFANEPHLPWKIARKALRMSVYPAFSKVVLSGGHGSIMQAILQKPETERATNKNLV